MLFRSEHAEEQRHWEKYSAKLEEVNRLVLSMAQQVGEDVEHLPHFDNPNLVRCWEEMECGQKDCPLYGKEATRCWQIKGNLFRAETGEIPKCSETCRTCRVFNLACKDFLAKTGEVLNNMFYIIGQDRKEIHRQSLNYIEMLGFVSHELKTPLVALSGYVFMLNDGALGELNPKQKKALQVIEGNVSHIQEMIANYLDLSRLEKGEMKPEFQTINVLTEVILPTIRNLKGLLASKGIKEELENLASEEVLIEGDRNMLTIIFNNLLSNAVKYGKENDKILEIGTGSGYNAALLSELVGAKGKIITLECVKELYKYAKKKLNNFN